MGCEDGVYQGRFPQPGLTCGNCQAQNLPINVLLGHTNANNVELKSTFEQFTFNLGGNAIETDMALRHHRALLWRHCSRHDGLCR